MKNFRVTVNGNTYDVAVEELAPGQIPTPAAPPIPVATAPKPAVTPVAPSATAPAPAPSATPAPATGGTVFAAPMPGVVLDIKVAVGDKVGKNQVVAILEAMKMENEIVTPVEGVVAGIQIAKGASVNSGDVLIRIS